MSKRSISLQHPALARGDLVSSSLEVFAARVAAKPRRQTRLRQAGRARCGQLRGGGAYRDRTDDLMLAKQPLYHLS